METTCDPYLRYLFDGNDILDIYNADTINLSIGIPGPDLLEECIEIMKKATDHRLEEEKKERKYYLFQYGIAAGLWECRNELASFLTRRYGDQVKRENLILTCGASHGCHLLLSTVISPNGVIFVEEVTYMSALCIFKQFSLLKIVTVPMKNDIVDLDAFEEIVKEEKKKREFFIDEQKMFWGMFYTTPTFHNPTGLTLPPESCKRLVEIARNYSVLVVCDDVYNLLYYGDGNPPHRLFFYDDPTDSNYRGGNVVSNGTFSKLLFPGIRCGWIECSSRVTNIFKVSGVLHSSGAVNHYISGIITSLLHLKLQDEFLDKLIEIFKERLSVLCNVLDQYLPKSCSYTRPEGGYFVWLHIPSHIDDRDFIEWCKKEYKVSALPGTKFSYTEKSQHSLRLSIGFHNKEVSETASKTLCNALSSYIEKHSNSNPDSTRFKNVCIKYSEL